MKKITLYLILLLFSCSTKTIGYDTIEFVAYNWRENRQDYKWNLYCTMYAKIDDQGKVNIVTEQFFDNPEMKFFSTVFNKEMLEDVVRQSYEMSNTDLRPSLGETLYSGPELKIRISHDNNKYSIIHFHDDNTLANNEPYIMIYNLLNSIVANKKYMDLTDEKTIDNLMKDRICFINNVIIIDTLLRPLPPKPEIPTLK